MAIASIILADAADPVWKVGFGIVVFILWGIGAMASAVRKQKQQERLRQRQMLTEVEQEMRGRREAAMGRRGPDAPVPVMMPAPMQVPRQLQPPPPPRVPPQWMTPPGAVTAPPPPPLPSMPAHRAPVPAQRVPQPVQPRTKGKRARRTMAAAPPVVPLPPRQYQAGAPVQRLSPIEQLAGAARETNPPANAVALHHWLSAGTLRTQFILTEILQPPLALREPQE